MELRRNDPCPCGSGRKYKKCCADAGGPARDLVDETAELVRQGDLPAALARFAGEALSGSDAAGIYYRLALALKERGFTAESAAGYRQTLALRPDDVAALNNLGVIHQEQREFTAAEALFHRARELRPDVAIGHYNLGVVLVALDRGAEARQCFVQALALQPNYLEAHYNLGLLARERGEWAAAEAHFRSALALRPDYPRAQTELAILAWQKGDFAGCGAALAQIVASQQRPTAEEERTVGHYRKFLSRLLEYRSTRGDLYQGGDELPLLYAVGDSHCLAPAHLPVFLGEAVYRVAPRLVVGAKAWHLGRPQPNHYQNALAQIVAAIPAGAPVLASFGEIDCRLDEGIIVHHRQTGSDLAQAIPALVADYLNHLAQLCGAQGLRLLVANVPAPLNSAVAVGAAELQLQALVIREFNRVLDEGCIALNLPLLDLYGASVGPDGRASGRAHLDAVHLEPGLYQKLLGNLPL